MCLLPSNNAGIPCDEIITLLAGKEEAEHFVFARHISSLCRLDLLHPIFPSYLYFEEFLAIVLIEGHAEDPVIPYYVICYLDRHDLTPTKLKQLSPPKLHDLPSISLLPLLDANILLEDSVEGAEPSLHELGPQVSPLLMGLVAHQL